MAMTPFQRLQAKADTHAHLSPRFFGEQVTFAPQAAGERPVIGNVEVTVLEEADESQNLVLRHELSLHCSRDVRHVRGGIDRIEVGDLLYRSREIDPDQTPFVATGERRNENALTWSLIFTRRITKGRGFDD